MKQKLTFFTLLTLSLFALFLSFLQMPELAFSAGQPCYSCSDKKFVCYKGGDTFAKRKEAQDKFQCNVTATSTCSPAQCKGRNLD